MVERDGVRLGVLNLSGNLFMKAGRAAFAEADAAVRDLAARADHVLVDMHAEATSEKVGLGWHLDGRVTAVVGTHTHVPTADARASRARTAASAREHASAVGTVVCVPTTARYHQPSVNRASGVASPYRQRRRARRRTGHVGYP